MRRRLLPALPAAAFTTLLAPAGAAAFRFRTRVRYRVGNLRLFRTVTLPQYVDIG